MNPLDLLKLAPWALVLAIGIFAGVERIQISNRNTTIAQKDTAISDMKKTQAENIARAEKAVRERMQSEIDNNNTVIKGLNADKAALQEKANAAESALAGITVTPTPEGCPEPMGLPVMRALVGGLPDR